MAELFRRWKNELKTEFVDEDLTPEFTEKYEKIRGHWPAFVAHKTSDKSKKMSATNKINAAKKEHHHRTGSGGYLKARPLWAKAENDLLDKVVELETLNWPDCSRTRGWRNLVPCNWEVCLDERATVNTRQEASAVY